MEAGFRRNKSKKQDIAGNTNPIVQVRAAEKSRKGNRMLRTDDCFVDYCYYYFDSIILIKKDRLPHRPK